MPDPANFHDAAAKLQQAPALGELLEELKTGLAQYWSAADEILKPCGVRLYPLGEAAFSLAKNFFSLIFLYSYRRAGIGRERRILFATTLQCLRGMVTGCDNLLDDEYKPTLTTDIPENGIRFRSVVDIMVSDRVLFHVLANAADRDLIPAERVLAASAASMQTMMRSGVEEASEEGGISMILSPEKVLESVHHFKTGILFQCPWDIPCAVDSFPEATLGPLLGGLYDIGMGCQILDDVVDFATDIRSRKHNYLVSLIYHGSEAPEKERLVQALLATEKTAVSADAHRFPVALSVAEKTARQMMTHGFKRLFADEDRDLVMPAVRFLQGRIGAVEVV